MARSDAMSDQGLARDPDGLEGLRRHDLPQVVLFGQQRRAEGGGWKADLVTRLQYRQQASYEWSYRTAESEHA